ncbi:PREDICTED: WD repeat- and FYVE domain-containing protein 4-like [Gekko japonicus]|uniref:WD repeat- and FYVE domain-containing protein 4-like n=1 Tax=Gekko japonicus TaxID=146911 RepID=A0ABM1K7H8_GEKJA|nr:PREDICTED: WD repeat- and FYVE domain-containing protein 4-like [Gekko japonicus]
MGFTFQSGLSSLWRILSALYGHRGAVTCLAASASYGVVVSGSADRSGIIWDLHRLTRLARLPAHPACLSAVAVSDSTGDIACCAGTALYIWNISGKPLAKLDSACGSGSTLSCCCFLTVADWDVHGLIATGDTGGHVQVWKLGTASPQRLDGSSDSQESLAKKAGGREEPPLLLRRELERSSAACPWNRPGRAAALTTLAVSRNSSRLLAGDENGRLFCWSMDE